MEYPPADVQPETKLKSDSGKLLEPLVVGTREFLNEHVKVAAEMIEVGNDVAKRISEAAGNKAATIKP